MSQLDDLLNRSRAPGTFVERRRFSLSRGKAIEKLREFALRNPRQYVLELVQSAVFSGATYVAIDVDHEHMLLAWVGADPIRPEQLENIFDYLFADRGARPTRHLVQLAIGLNAILQRKPKVLRIESGDGTLDGTTRLDLNKKGEGQIGRPAEPLAGTYILAEFSSSWFKRFQGDSWTPEEGLVESECRYTPVPILLNGRAPFGWKACRNITWFGKDPHLAFDDGDRRGVLALPDSGRSKTVPGVQLIVGGVRITTAAIPELGTLPAPGGAARELMGVICDDNLRKTADQSDIVRDGRYAAMLHAVQPTATQLIQQVAGKGYQPPRLPHLGSARSQTAEPLPEPLPQLLPRPTLDLEALQAIHEGSPCFFVTPADAADLWAVADPGRFPYPVLVLTPGQVETLDAEAPHIAVHRLNTAADIDFVRRALEQRRRQREVRVERPGRDGSDTVVLRLVLDGPRTLWGDPRAGDVAVRVQVGAQTQWCGMVPGGVPGLSVSLEVDSAPDGAAERLGLDVLDDALREAWRLLPDRVEAIDADAVRRFAIGLLAAHARPHFERDGAGQTRLSVHLPLEWGPVADRLLDLPLARTHGGPLTLRRLAALQGTDAALALTDPADLDLLTPLEDRLGLGHLRVSALDGLLSVIAHAKVGWSRWTDARWDVPQVREVLGLALTFGPLPPDAIPAGWRQVQTDLPLIVHLVRDGIEVAEDRREAGLALLQRTLGSLQDTDRWRAHVPPGVPPERVYRALVLARMHLCGRVGELDDARVLPMATAGATLRLRDAADFADFAVSPRHGPALDEPQTAMLSLDELTALEEHLDRTLPLRFDDPPAVWASLAAPESGAWLIRHEVSVPGLRGWLGLRLPFDATSGVFVQGSTTLLALTDLDANVPVHGLLRLSSGQLRPNRQQRELLQLARQQMYQELSAMLIGGLDAASDAACQRYAMAYTHSAWLESGGQLAGTAAQMAARVQVRDAAGKAWGSLQRWLNAAADARPDLPITLPAALRRVAEEQSAEVANHLEDRLQQLRGRLVAAAEGPLPDVRLTFQPVWTLGEDVLVEVSGSGGDLTSAVLEVNLQHPLCARIEQGDAAAAEVLLLEAARALTRWGRGVSRAVDLLAIQRVLVAQRLR